MPPGWFVDLPERRVDVLIYDEGVGGRSFSVSGTGAKLLHTSSFPNDNYVKLTLLVDADAEPTTLQLRAGGGKSYPFPLEEAKQPRSMSAADLIYLAMPDRFANGDESNDRVNGTRDYLVNRDKVFFRHGGDLAGIQERLDYLEDLGVTALWINPVLENDQPYASYHGYAVTDHYRIDPRFGTNEDYRRLVEAAHARGIKIIMDVIFNHVGDEHFFIRDLPSEDWIHQWPEYTKTTYRATTLMDPHASEYDRKLMTDGWFDKHMPDLNQQNEHLARYLIQNSLWWTLWSGQDAFRIDTYAYADPDFTSEWNRRMLEELPNLGIYGETWVHGPAVQAYFTGGRQIHQEFDTHLPGVTDFQVYYAITEAMNRNPGWTEGVLRLYYSLAQDYLYDDPSKNVIFLDNHDLARIYTVMGEDMTKMKGALALLLTLRGIPMLYYGTEVGLTGSGGAFGEGGRVDFPGGFPRDSVDYFNETDRSGTEEELFDYVRRLARFRKDSPALTEGTFTHYVPRDGVYVYFRQQRGQTVMVAFNANDTARENFDLADFSDQLEGFGGAYDLTADTRVGQLRALDLAPKEVKVYVME